MEKKIVAVLGASSNPSRYSYQAVSLLHEQGYEVYPVNPQEQMVAGLKSWPTLSILDAFFKSTQKRIHTLTLYVNPRISHQLEKEILDFHPLRVIFNPGAESTELKQILENHHIEVIEGCTLVMLRTSQF